MNRKKYISQLTSSTLRFEFSAVYKPLFSTGRRIIDLWGGRGRGGSYAGTDWFLYKLITAEYFRGCFVRRIQTDIRHSLFRDFRDRIEEKNLPVELFKINEGEMSITYLPTGNIITSKGVYKDSARTAKMKSMAGYTDLLMEEADEIDEPDFNQIVDSLRTVKAPIKVVRIFNPPAKDHWLWKDYNLSDCKININGKHETFYTAIPKSRADIESVFSTYRNNLRNIDEKTVQRYESYIDTNPEYYYSVIRGLISTGARGRVYTGWHQINEVDFADIECRPVYVIDFGYNPDPTALLQVKWRDDRIYVKELLYEYELDDLTLAKRLNDLGIDYHDTIIADYGNGGHVRINNFVTGGNGAWDNIEGYPWLRSGFSMVAAKKGSGSVKDGIT